MMIFLEDEAEINGLRFNVSLNLKIYRERANLTQQQAADKLGVSANTISNWERGIIEPSYDTFDKLADIYNVTVWQFFKKVPYVKVPDTTTKGTITYVE